MKRINRKKGFTLVELMVALSVSLLVISSITSSIHQISSGLTRTNDQVYLNSQFQLLLDKFYQETRGIMEVHASLPTAFEFSYLKQANKTERIRYSWDASTSELTITSINNNMVRNNPVSFSNVKFSYFDKFGKPVETVYSTNINVNAVQVTFSQSQGTASQEVVQSPIIMFRNKPLI